MFDRQTYRDAVEAGWPFGVALFLAEEVASALDQTSCEHECTHLEDGKLMCIFCGEIVEVPRV
jgi:hypothetical protein